MQPGKKLIVRVQKIIHLSVLFNCFLLTIVSISKAGITENLEIPYIVYENKVYGVQGDLVTDADIEPFRLLPEPEKYACISYCGRNDFCVAVTYNR